MYKEIENIIVRTLSPFEYEQLELLKNNYSENSIIKVYKEYGDKPINYIKKVLSTKMKKVPIWLNEEIKPEPIDEETQKEFDDFNNFIKEFRND